MADQLLLIQACPALTDFQWINVESGDEYPSSDDFDEYRQGVVQDELDKVEELEIAGTQTDSSIALAINNMPRIRSLILAKNGLGPLSFEAIQPSLSTLCRFDVQSHDITSAMIQTILCSCPVLEFFRAGVMIARDAIAEDKDWACMSTLKVLSLSFRFESHETHLQDALFARLARLTRLEQLIMHEPCTEFEGEFGLRLSLEQGFGRLSTLTGMKFLSTIDDETQTLGTEEVEWMRMHWPDLITFCSYTSQGDSAWERILE
ncbi:hypothetical protein BGZ70_005082 [Mortierella alpina]|uniref:Uncharacterized protein n=1 Tax=Mortierella alpina TaxID=64518 RepID=A0A9P6M4L7_MORAP|nr:hypothetical protein BGZ70_005082 [Mortierella alpina]